MYSLPFKGLEWTNILELLRRPRSLMATLVQASSTIKVHNVHHRGRTVMVELATTKATVRDIRHLREDTHKKSVFFRGRITKGVGRSNQANNTHCAILVEKGPGELYNLDTLCNISRGRSR